MTLPGTGHVHDDDGEVLDQIRLVGLRATGHHGVFEHERANGQEFVADVVVHLDTRPAAVGDALARTVHYGVLAERVTAVLSSSPADLIETVAERIAAVALAEPAAVAVDVILHKPEAPITVPFDDVVVAVRRSRTRPPVVPVPVEPLAAATEEPASPEVVLPPAIPPGTAPEPGAGLAPVLAPVVLAPVLLPPVALPDDVAPVPLAATGSAGLPGVPDEPLAPTVDEPALGEGDDDVAPEQPGVEDHAAFAAVLREHDRMDEIPASPVDVVLALGSNVGDPQQTLRDAISALDAIGGIEVLEVSPLARTAPVGGVDQDDFLNAVVVARTSMSARELLHACQDVEHSFGRVREQRWGPRTLDVDIVVYGTLTDVADDLELPHPRAHERAFVLEPWSQVQPDAVLPGLGGGPVAQLAATAPDRAGIRWLALDWLGGPEPEHAPAEAEAPVSHVAHGVPAADPLVPAGPGADPVPASPPPPAIAPGAPVSAVAAAPSGAVPTTRDAIAYSAEWPAAAETLPGPSSAPTQSSPTQSAPMEFSPVRSSPAHPAEQADPARPAEPSLVQPSLVQPARPVVPSGSFETLPAPEPVPPVAPSQPSPSQPSPTQPAAVPPTGVQQAEPSSPVEPAAPAAQPTGPAAQPTAQPAPLAPLRPDDRRGDGPVDAATAVPAGDPFAPNTGGDPFAFLGDHLGRPVADPFVAPTADPLAVPDAAGFGFPPVRRDDAPPEAPRFAPTSSATGIHATAPPATVTAPGPTAAPGDFHPASQPGAPAARVAPPVAPASVVVPPVAPASVVVPPAPPTPASTSFDLPVRATAAPAAPQATVAPQPAGGLLTGVPMSFPPVSGGTRAVEPPRAVAAPAHPTVSVVPESAPAPARSDPAAQVPGFPPLADPGPLAAAPLFPPTTEEPPTR